MNGKINVYPVLNGYVVELKTLMPEVSSQVEDSGIMSAII